MPSRNTLLVIAGLLLATPAIAETLEISDNRGGSIADYQTYWEAIAGRGVNVKIIGPCVSACTLIFKYIPRDKICVTPAARFGFHLGTTPLATGSLYEAYSADIRAWIDAHGGLTHNFIYMRAPDTYRYFRAC
jgi:hypothetical protein